ncbi:Bacteroides conjugative transposon TraJ protein [Mucilaginibacter pineti]|uniref:Bacteroides conjugative transposon TraJ protein n=1 Tax=Mucilaginibacter pineti TaxID=1391627 RepID=A0A1G7EQ24_9SPHI|nr:conjugative transposon protein TraJ [Mucilaginibacter pineti]SDE65707.1 Bacteroides conjugative transposon TraJ protein [Mucilaginibacter pineti]
MKTKLMISTILVLTGIAFPLFSQAQGVATDVHSLQSVLDNVYKEMLPLCGRLIGVARGIAGFGALWYIASRVWRHLAAAEPIDFYPLLRPFGIGLAILLFPSVIALMNGILQPISDATGGMVTDSNRAIAALLKKKEDAIKKSETYQMYVGDDGQGDRAAWYKYTHPEDQDGSKEGTFESIGNDVKFWMDKQSYAFRNNIKQWMSEVLQVLYEAAALCINTIRTFYLIVLAILGPLVFGLSVYDGFSHTLTVWIARYVNIFLWLPVANIFGSILGKIQENMLRLDISQVQQAGDTFFSATDTAYLIYMVIGIMGYFTVPSVANYIVHAGGGNGLLQKVNTLVSTTSHATTAAASGGAGMVRDAINPNMQKIQLGMAENGASGGYFGSNNDYQKNKLSGN